jgi:hypothetical protein
VVCGRVENVSIRKSFKSLWEVCIL